MKAREVIILSAISLLVWSGMAFAQTEEELLAIHKAQFDAMNVHDLDTMMSYWADDAVYDLVPSPPPVSVDIVRMVFANIFATQPDFRMVEGPTWASGNTVVEESVTIRTNAEVGVEVSSPHLSIYDFEGEKIKRVTSYKDNLSDMVQLGMMEAPQTPSLVPSAEVPDPEPTNLSALEANAELIARWNSHDAAAVAKMDHADVQIFAGPLGTEIDRAAMMALNEMYFASFPDDVLEVVRTIDLGDGWVLTELISHATHREPFMGVPASGHLMRVRVVWLTQYDADGLVTDMSFYYDNITLINQMTTAEWPLDGIWVTSYPTPAGTLLTSTVYTAQDADKTQYSGTLNWLNAHPILSQLYPGYNPSLGISAGGQATKVGRQQYKATYLGYEREYVGDMTGIEIVGIWIAHANFELTGPDQLQGYGTVSYYAATQDANQDGYPDDGEQPLTCAPWQWSGRRITHVPACIPPGSGN